MYKQDCSDFQNHYIYKNISLKNLGLSKTLTYKYKSMMEGPKARVHICTCVNVPSRATEKLPI